MERLESFTDKGLLDYIRELEHQASVQILYDDASKTEQGKFLRKQFEDSLSYWRSQYGQIDSSSASALSMFSFIQGIEYCLRSLVARMADAGGQAEFSREEIKRVREFLQNKKKIENSRTFLPGGYKKEKCK